MHSLFIRRFSLILASWLMVTSVGASIDVHFCMGEMYSIGINADAETCDGYNSESSENLAKSFRKTPCCDQFLAYFQSDVDNGHDDVVIQYFFDLILIPSQYNVRIPHSVEPIQLCDFYHPPEYEEDLQALFSVFRI